MSVKFVQLAAVQFKRFDFSKKIIFLRWVVCKYWIVFLCVMFR